MKLEELLDDIDRHLASAEVIHIKEGLWKASIAIIAKKYGITGEGDFLQVEEIIRARLSGAGGAGSISASMQDALNEFRSESRQLLNQ